jgi:hypothetical protein
MFGNVQSTGRMPIDPPWRTSLLLALVFALPIAQAKGADAAFPLRVSADLHHLEDSGGRPFLIVGDTAWSLVAQLDEDNIARYLDERAQRGFNSIIVNLIEHKFASHAPAKLDGTQPFLKPGDFTQPNPVYFDFAHRAVEQARRRGISVWLFPAYLGWKGGDEGFFNEIAAAGPAALRQYGRFIGEHFKDLPNIVWVMGGDFALSPTNRWTGSELAAGLRDGGAKQLMSAHGGQTSALDTFGDQPWLAVDTVYSYATNLYVPLLANHARSPMRPFVLIESTYEGEHDSRPEQIRRQAWWAMLCGACGQFFGNNPIWHFDGPTLFPHKDTWQEALGSVGSRDIARLGNFLASRPWFQLVPDQGNQLVTSGSALGPSQVAVAVARDQRFALVYIPADGRKPRELIVNFDAFSAPVNAKWFNPARDTEFIAHDAAPSNRGSQKLQTPGDNGTGVNDWVLVLEAR